jgi:hypothetical protein
VALSQLREYYRAAIRDEHLIGHFSGIIVLVRLPRHYSVPTVSEQSQDFVQGTEDWRMRKYLF